jgi:hypothetical protein
MLRDFLTTSTWALPKGTMSGKKRAAQGVNKLEDSGQPEPEFATLAWKKLGEAWPDWCVDSESDSD